MLGHHEELTTLHLALVQMVVLFWQKALRGETWLLIFKHKRYRLSAYLYASSDNWSLWLQGIFFDNIESLVFGDNFFDFGYFMAFGYYKLVSLSVDYLVLGLG